MNENKIEEASKEITSYLVDTIEKVFDEMVSETIEEMDRLYLLINEESSDKSEINAQREKARKANDAITKIAEYKERVLRALAGE